MNLLATMKRSVRMPTNIALLILAVIFFVAYSWLYAVSGNTYNSPDENANFVFSSEFIESGSFKIERPSGLDPLVRPRSTNIFEDNLVPVSFLGLPLFLGGIGKLLGDWVLIFLPALLSVLGVLAFYGITRRLFAEKTAFLSSVLLFFLPQWWYFSARGFLPNVPMLAAFLIAAYLMIKGAEAPPKKAWSIFLGAGFVLGLSLAIRPIEIWWLLLVLVVAAFLYRKLSWVNLVFIGAGTALALIPLLYFQSLTYGSILATGYSQLSPVGQMGQGAGENAGFVSLGRLLSQSFFPFGLDLLASFGRFWQFTWQLFWLQLALFTVGLLAWLKSPNKSTAQRKYLSTWLIISVYLIIYYGSWVISDHPQVERVSLGISYVRYWLPIYIGALPFVAFGVVQIVGTFKSTKRIVATSLLLLFFSLNSVFLLYSFKDDNLGRIRESIVEYSHVRQEIKKFTPPNAIIISDRNDKIFWPVRQVIHYQNQDYQFVSHLPELLKKDLSVYWLASLPASHVRVLEEREFLSKGLVIEGGQKISDQFTLYKINIK